MASSSLQSASAYLNNLLLARGLLQDGKAIDFASPAHHGNLEQTMSRIINLTHDLVLRRDGDAGQRENLSGIIHSLRANAAQGVLDLQRVQDKNVDVLRDLATVQTRERNAKAALMKAEAEIKITKEQMLKMKSTLDQVRAKCISDVRKRDVELERLKGHLTSLQRGKREGSGMKINSMRSRTDGQAVHEDKGQGATNPEWSLEKETNDFLAAIVNETSTENVTLRSIVIETMATLKELTGVGDEASTEGEPLDDAIGIPGQYRKSHPVNGASNSIVPCEKLATQMATILQHCQAILKDPSFVPIEEVQLREEEIIKLRTGWEKMAARWKEAVTMMDSWRRRIVEGHEPFDVDELSNLGFGRSVAFMPNGEPVLGQDEDLSSMLYDHSRTSNEELEVRDESEEISDAGESDLDIPPEPSPKRLAASPARRGIKLPRPLQPLSEFDANARQRRRREASVAAHRDEPAQSSSILDGTLDENDTFRHIPVSKIPRQAAAKVSPPMTVDEKLAAIENEAREAELAREQEPTHKRKATRRTDARSRRRSTLSPEELASLMGVR